MYINFESWRKHVTQFHIIQNLMYFAILCITMSLWYFIIYISLIRHCLSPFSHSSLVVDVDRHPLEGAGSYRVTGNRLRMKQLVGVIVKRFHYIRRNWKGLFSQILLPAMFVCIAMTVALTAPKVEDLPPLVLSPAQYYNYTQPRGNFVPYNNEALITKQQNNQHKSKLYINSQQLIHTFYLPSGLGATCVLKKPFNNSFDADILKTITQNYSSSTFQLLSRYFEPGCESVFVHGLPLSNFVPPPPTAAPTPPLNLEANGSYIRSTGSWNIFEIFYFKYLTMWGI